MPMGLLVDSVVYFPDTYQSLYSIKLSINNNTIIFQYPSYAGAAPWHNGMVQYMLAPPAIQPIDESYNLPSHMAGPYKNDGPTRNIPVMMQATEAAAYANIMPQVC